MPAITFGKLHGFGNDYIVFEADDLIRIGNINEFAKQVCHRHTGIGGDGIAILKRLESEADFECRIINPDGSEAGFSGNGTRCAVAYLFYKHLWKNENLKLKTKSGIKNYQLLKREANAFWFLAELGKPQSVTNDELRMTNGLLPVVTLDVGNPVCAVFTDDFDAINWRKMGAEIEPHAHFPERTNVVFVKTIDGANVEIRIWERGAGETASSGTCSIAAAVASRFAGKTNETISVHAPGGTTEAVWREADGEMLITGRADLVFCGEFYK